ncbi:WD40-repeat-containing domain protein [Radiomyces spectabilis]|uniref:WD40-repeat-containing domain protein n=1 Tax=Radiomyces spectabilis TaxID=64574 RepID=UPI00221E4904|nr:WD40-repeat-containing domain protein [Radiomyces spectabilis]KAI8372713.1 WD40-repeat-containing domain protein [Radiomyces spectabilis]
MNKVPNPLKFNQAVFDFALHPTDDLVATGLINGEIHCYRYGVEEHQSIWTAKPFRKSCRGLEFSPDGNGLYGISKDRSIQFMDTATGQLIRSKTESHENPLNVLLCLNERLLATGDDQGIIKLWDNRDGYLSTWDIRKPDVAAMSDNMEDELLSVALVKNGRKAVVGSQEGVLSLWSWGDWGDYKDRIIGHPNSIDAICKLDEDTICTGSSDGLIRYEKKS